MSRHHTDRHPPSPLDRRESNVDDGAGRVPGQRARGEPTRTSSSKACLQDPLPSLQCHVTMIIIVIVMDRRPAARFKQTTPDTEMAQVTMRTRSFADMSCSIAARCCLWAIGGRCSSFATYSLVFH